MTDDATGQRPKTFDPSRYLSLVSGKDYLEVKWRLVWFRDESPAGRIETELLRYEDNEAVFKATVTRIGELGEVLGLATGYGSEDAKGFGDYLEKAETKAIGRALAALGYGTQFCGDHDFGTGAPGNVRTVDPPVQFDRRQSTGGGGSGSDLAATDRQRNLILTLGREQKISRQVIDEMAVGETGAPFDQLTRKQASTLIEFLRDRRGPEAMG